MRDARSESQEIACIPQLRIVAAPMSQLTTLNIRSILLFHIFHILGLAREQNIAAIYKSHVTVSIQISLHS